MLENQIIEQKCIIDTTAKGVKKMPRPISMRAKSHFGMIIYKRLTQMGKNQKYLAEKTGFSQLYISEILNGKHNPSIKAIYNISKVTGISIEELTKALLDEN